MYNKIIVHHIMFHINQNCSSMQLSVCVATCILRTCFSLTRQLSSYTCTCGNEKKKKTRWRFQQVFLHKHDHDSQREREKCIGRKEKDK